MDPCAAMNTTCAPWAECYVEGVLPCSGTLSGNLFLFVVYGIIMYIGSMLLFEHSRKLLEVVPVESTSVRWLVGIVNPLLSVVPITAVLVASGFGGGQLELQQKRMSVGIGALAGSVVFSLSIAWACVLVLGRCDLRNGDMVDGELTDFTDVLGTGVSVDKNTRQQALMMAITAVTYVLVQGSAFATLGETVEAMTDDQKPFIVATSVFAGLLFVVYMGIQQTDRHIFERRIREAQTKKLIKDVVASFVRNVTRAPNMTAAALADRKQSYDWMGAVQHEKTEAQASSLQAKAGLAYNIFMIILGFSIVVMVAYPLVESVMTACESIGIDDPELYVAFFAVPVICNGSNYIGVLLDASYKKKKSISQSTVTLYNTVCVMIFTAVLYSRSLVWEWGTETVVIIAFCVTSGVVGFLLPIYRAFWTFFALSGYFAGLLLVLVFNSSIVYS